MTEESAMKRSSSLLAVGVLLSSSLLASGTQPGGEAAKEEMKKLQGAWTVVSAEFGGQDVPVAKLGIFKVEFKDDKMHYLKPDGTTAKTFGFTLDPSKKPKAMDWINLEDKDAIKLPAIYSLDGDELKLCFPMLPKKGEKNAPPITRPENFETKDRPVGLFVAKRAKS
jgi:uncharacterized protein (TIGR03067 family)